MVSETRYFRSDSHTINGLTARQLKTTNTSASTSVFRDLDGYQGGYLRAKVYKRTSDGTETLIATSSSIFVDVDTSPYEYSIDCVIPQTVLNLTDAVVVRIEVAPYSDPTDFQVIGTWITEQLNDTQLDGVTWTFKLWSNCIYNEETDKSRLYFRFGSSTYNSRILNFSHSTPTLITERGDGLVWMRV